MKKKHLISITGIIFLAFTLSAMSARNKGPDKYWNVTPNDVNNLLKQLKRMADVDYQMDIKSMAKVNPDPEQNPVLFRTGHYNFEYSAGTRKKLREFLMGGGMIIYNTGLGSAPFYRSVKKEMVKVFPEQPMQRLSSDHPIFHSYFSVDAVKYTPAVYQSSYYKGFRGNEPWFDGVEINCRLVSVVSRWGLACGWTGEVKDEYQAYQPESSWKLGMNIFSYASAMRAWAKNAAQTMKFLDEDDHVVDKVSMVQVVYDGIWKTRHAGISVLLQTFNNKTSIPVKFGLVETRLSNAKIFNAPLIFITGHENFRLKKTEAQQLRQYLKSGGFVFAEACCGRKGFDLSFRELMRTVMPTEPMKKIPNESMIFAHPNKLTSIGVTPTLEQDIGKATVAPRLEGIEVDGNYVVVYSPLGMQGGWEMSQSPFARGYNDVGSLKLGQNILMYAITQ